MTVFKNHYAQSKEMESHNSNQIKLNFKMQMKTQNNSTTFEV